MGALRFQYSTSYLKFNFSPKKGILKLAGYIKTQFSIKFHTLSFILGGLTEV